MDEFCKLVHTTKSQWSLSDCRSRSQIDKMAVRNIHRIPTEILNQSNLLKVFGVSLEMSSDPKKYFGFTFDQFTELVSVVYTAKNRSVFDTTICDTAGHGLK